MMSNVLNFIKDVLEAANNYWTLVVVIIGLSIALYEKIKKYVAEHNDGMKVSNLYIAQVKAKYGIIERENYNLPKSEDTKHPQCPKEKEDAIVEALRFFRMI